MTTDPTSGPEGSGPAAPTPNPFAGIPARDLIVDVSAFLLLLISLALPWNINYSKGVINANDNVLVVLVTILSILSLALTYLGRARVFGTAVSAAQVGLIRAAANLPYALLVMALVIVDLAKVNSDSRAFPFIGYAAAFGLAGAALAGMPRVAESDKSETGGFKATILRLVLLGLAGLWIVVNFVGTINVFIDWTGLDLKVATIASFLLLQFVVFVPLALLAYGLLRRSAVARTAAIVAGAVALGIAIVSWLGDWEISGGLESAHVPGLCVIAFMSLGVVASSHLVGASMHSIPDVQRYSRTAGVALLAQAGLAVASIFLMVLAFAADSVDSKIKGVGAIFTLLITAALAAVAFMMLRTDKSSTRLLALGAIAASLVVGILTAVLVKGATGVDIITVAVAFGLPLATLSLLLVPASMRAKLGSLNSKGAATEG